MADDKLIEIIVNGDKREVPDGLNINGLLDFLKVRKTAAVVEHNRTVLKQREHNEITVNAGDTLEIVRFVGGG